MATDKTLKTVIHTHRLPPLLQIKPTDCSAGYDGGRREGGDTLPSVLNPIGLAGAVRNSPKTYKLTVQLIRGPESQSRWRPRFGPVQPLTLNEALCPVPHGGACHFMKQVGPTGQAVRDGLLLLIVRI